MESTSTILILGGAGMVGLQVAREAVRELRPERIVISALTQAEVDQALEVLRGETRDVEFEGAPGDIFLPTSLQGIDRADIIANRKHFDELFSQDSFLLQLVERHKPEVIVDCINTATAIAYLDVFTVTERTRMLLDAVEARRAPIDRNELEPLIRSVRELMIAQGVPQIVRHIVVLHRALENTSVRVYVKVGTTGTGGMGINIPYTHSEDKPSPQLLSKSAIGFAHTGLLFLLARTPGASIIKEIKPGAMIGFKRLGETHVRLRGDRKPAYLVAPREEALGSALDTHQPPDSYEKFEGRDVPLKIIGADTGENGFFSIGEFQAITYPRQMEYVTPEEVARTTILEILGASTGRDVLSAIDGAITEPSYRAGVLRAEAIRAMERLEAAARDRLLPSIAVGHLGPPKLSKLLIEAFLLREALGDDFAAMLSVPAKQVQRSVETHLDAHPEIVSLVATIGIPLLRASGAALRLTRGPRINIPPAHAGNAPAPLDRASVESYARTGWVDLRVENFELWRERIERLSKSRPDIVAQGSAAFDVTKYTADRFVPGDVVGWLLTNEVDEEGMVGRRLF
ncbi:MAG TPA: hypothetical protein VL284_14690 [Thermoanaerobaculia bacterium]|nr:hypothetical protein [Thermoanaerobaculia bacterium]